MADDCPSLAEIQATLDTIQNDLAKIKEAIEALDVGGAAAPRKKRKPSKYNIFIGDCMRGNKDTMSNCAAKYKAAKAAGTL